MVMIQPAGKAKKIAIRVLKGKGIDKPKSNKIEKKKLEGPYLQH
jgi:hypothetical protein